MRRGRSTGSSSTGGVRRTRTILAVRWGVRRRGGWVCRWVRGGGGGGRDADHPGRGVGSAGAGGVGLPLDAWLGDDRDGAEPQDDREARKAAAIEVCLNCPVMVQCDVYANTVTPDGKLLEPSGI